jgi:hypothetical protein
MGQPYAGEIIDNSRLFVLNEDLDTRLETEVHQEVGSIYRDNDAAKTRSNGFTDDRTMRQIGHIPMVDWLKAMQDGYHIEENDPALRGRELKRLLNDRPWLRTVNHINTPGHTGQIIVK